MMIVKPQPALTQPWEESISLDLKKRTLEASLSGLIRITRETPASLDLEADVDTDELGGKFKTNGNFDRLTGQLYLDHRAVGEAIASNYISMNCTPMKPKF
ncbi:hypothetical protein [Hyphomicrobium sp. 2TAF46]|uniref:hypothetical protein n=1 Tax=Hyphomicrobium sp. 2TAF46 TaxID=3233019 RepID=UPI003F8FB983